MKGFHQISLRALMSQTLYLVAVLTAAFWSMGCQSANLRATEAETARLGTASNSISAAPSLEVRWHSIQKNPPTQLPAIPVCDKINPAWWFMNADEPVPPEWFCPGKKWRGLKWFWRNPFHNFSFYVIGIADKSFVRSGRYPEKISNPNGGWNVAVSKYKWLRLPYVSYWRGKFEFYAGWRTRGNFGIKIIGSRTDETTLESPAISSPEGNPPKSAPRP